MAREPGLLPSGSRSRAGAACLVTLALLIGSTATRAQAPLSLVTFLVKVLPDKEQVICVGQTKELLVRVERVVIGARAGARLVTDNKVSGVRVDGTLSNPRIATIKRKGLVTGEQTLDDPYEETGLRFDVTGVKPGTGRAEFKAKIGRYWIGEGAVEREPGKPIDVAGGVNVKVIPCKWEVGAVHTWPSTGVFAASMGDVTVAADDEGRLSGTGVLEWDAEAPFADCKTSTSVAPSGVDITGEVADDGLVTLHLAYEAATAKGSFKCPVGGPYPCRGCNKSGTSSIQPSEISLIVPADGGTVTSAQTISGSGGSTEGEAVITVVPVLDAPVARLGMRDSRGAPPALARRAAEG